jgi:hypothetical protein
MTPPVERFCVVCGMGSHRTDWLKQKGDFVACDSHSDEEFAKAITAKTPSPAASAK